MTTGCILVTGGCGYLGAHLLREMARHGEFEGARIRILDNLSAGSVAGLCDLPPGPRYEFVEGDILSPAAVRSALEGVGQVIHLAALVRTPFAFNQPGSIQQINHWGTAQLLEHCRAAGVERFIYASSVSVYGPGGPFDEQSACRPMGPYSRSKMLAEHAVLSGGETPMHSTVLRIGTLYGGEPGLMRFDAVANRFAYLAGTSRSLAVYGDGQQSRPLVHVRDAARAILFVLNHPQADGQTYNVAADNPSIEALARIFTAIRADTRLRFTDQDYREHLSLAVTSEKIRGLGWSAQEYLEPALRELLGHFGKLTSPFTATADRDLEEIVGS